MALALTCHAWWSHLCLHTAGGSSPYETCHFHIGLEVASVTWYKKSLTTWVLQATQRPEVITPPKDGSEPGTPEFKQGR